MAKKEGSGVPFAEWLTAFRIVNSAIAKAYDDHKKEILAKVGAIPAFGAVFRITLNKVLLPLLHKELATHEGIENLDQIYDFVVDALKRILANEETVKKLVESAVAEMGTTKFMGVNPAAFADAFVNALKMIVSYLPNYKNEILAKYKLATSA